MPRRESTKFIRKLRATTALFAALSLFVTQEAAYALPVGGTVAAGTATILNGRGTTTTTIDQYSRQAIINWQGFDVGANETVNFNQPRGGVTLNRVTGGNASQILGNINASGTVMLVNPQGVFFGGGARVNVGNLLATTADIDNARFMRGDYAFDKPGDPGAAIINEGHITVADGGLATLAGPNVGNSGIIDARLGKVQLGSGDTFTLDLYGDGLINLQASPAITQQIVDNSGVLAADGGKVEMTAAAGAQEINSLINMDGIIQANSVGRKNGEIVLYAEGSNAVQGNVTANKGKKGGSGDVVVSGTMTASGYGSGQTGGSVSVLGDNVGLLSGSIIDVSGDAGGGTVRIGGDFHGTGATPTALNTYVDSNSLILANANTSGNGGNVTVWSDGNTWFSGNILAEGGTNSGDGGFVETSGHGYLSADGYVDLLAPKGSKGTYLLDPTDIAIYGNFAPNYTSTDGTISLASSLQMWLDASDTSKVQLTYNSTGTTAVGTLGTNTITVGSNTGLVVGERVQIGGSSDTFAASVNDNASGSGIYTITNISGTTITLDANLAASVSGASVYGGYVSQLTDKSGNGNNAGQAIAANMPLWISNGQNGIGVAQFNGTSDSLQAGLTLSNVSSASLFSAMQFLTASGTPVAQGWGTFNSYGGLVILERNLSGQKFDVTFGNGTSTELHTGTTSANTNWHIQGGIFLEPTTTTLLDGVTTNTGSFAQNLSASSNFFLGSYANGQLPANMNEGETIYYNTALSANAQTLVNQYQSAKWGVALTGPGVIGTETGLTGAEAQAAMASTAAGATTDGYSAFTTRYLEHLSQTSNLILDASHNITLDFKGDTLNVNAGKNLTMTAGNEIVTASSGTINTSQSGGTGGNITLSAGTDIVLNNLSLNSGGGAITLDSNTAGAGGAISITGGTISSSGGAITLGGGATPLTTAAVGDAAYAVGVNLNNSTLSSGSGNIVVNGTGYSGGTNTGNAYGIELQAGAQANATGSSTITLTGTGGGSGSGSSNKGINLTSSSITSVSGAISITGTGGSGTGGSNDGVNITAVTSTGSAPITITGIAGSGTSTGLNISGAIGGASDTGNITLTADSLTNSGSYRTTGAVTFAPYTASTAINVATGSTGLQITSGILSSVTAGSITIGATGNSGNMDVGAETLSANTTLLTGSGNITFDGIQTLGTKTLTAMSASGNIVLDQGDKIVSTASSGNSIVLAGANFINNDTNDGTSALSPGTGTARYLVYSTNPTGNTMGSLSDAGIHLFNKTYAGYGPGSVTQSGNLWLYSYQPTITVTADNQSRNYGLSNPSLTYSLSGLVDGDTSSVLSGAPSINTVATSGSNVGGYTITASLNTLANSIGYALTTANGTLTVSAAPITITASDQTKTYGFGGTSAALGATGYSITAGSLYGSDAISGVTLATNASKSNSNNYETDAYNSNNPWTITPSAAVFSTGSSSNYAITYANAGTGLTVNAKTLTVTGLIAQDKTYDSTTANALSGTASLSGLVASDAVTLGGTASGAFADKNVGNSKAVTISGNTISGTDDNNYSFTQQSGLTANITKAALTITGVSGSNKVYNGTIADSITGTASLSGVLGSDTVNLGTGLASASFADKNVGSGKAVTFVGYTISGADAGNYSLSQPANSSANITAYGLTVSGMTADDKVYDATTAATIHNGGDSLVGVFAGDSVNLNAATTATFSDKNVGNGKTVTASGFTIGGADAGNYTLTQPTATANITAATLTISGVSANNRVYDATTSDTLTTAGDSLVGAIAGDTVNLSNAGATGSFADKNAGNGKAVTAAGFTISGADAGNYALTQPTGLTANITKAALTITGVSGSNKVYNGTIADSITGTASLSGVLGSDTVNLGTGSASASFADKNVGTGKTVSFSGYTISGADAGNYSLSQPANSSANITAKSLTVTADDKSMNVGDAVPPLTYAYSGLAAGDASASFTGGLTTSGTSGSPAGSYGITIGSLATTGNYRIGVFNDGMLTIGGGAASPPPAIVIPPAVRAVINQNAPALRPQEDIPEQQDTDSVNQLSALSPTANCGDSSTATGLRVPRRCRTAN